MRNKCFRCLLFLLLVFGIHSIGYSQNDSAQTNSSTPQLDTTQIWAEILPSVLHIRVIKKDESVNVGSGVLGGKDHKLAVTNAHITEGHNKVEIYFPAYDSDGELIQDSHFYFYKKSSVLRRLGYYTEGRVVMENPMTDVALVFLEGLPKTAKEIKSDENYDYSRIEKGTPVYIMGHPSNRSDFWQLDFGVFEEYQKREKFGLVISANMFYGNSGGPVVDKTGSLIGLISGGNMQTKSTHVVPIKHIYDLAKKTGWRNTFSIQNGTESTIVYEIQWSESRDWERYSIEPDGKTYSHTYYLPKKPPQKPPQGYPKIRFNEIPEAIPSTDLKDNEPISGDTPVKIYELRTTSEIFPQSLEERFVKEDGYDGYQYRFGHDSEENKINLYELRKTAWIANHVEFPVHYQIKWAPDESTRWKPYLLEPSKAHPHWWIESRRKILDGYPKILISKVVKERTLDPKTGTWIDTEVTYDRTHTLKVETEFFSIDTTEQDNIIDAEKPGSVKSENNYHRFELSPSDPGSVMPPNLVLGVPEPVLTTNVESPTRTFWGRSIVEWVVLAIFAFVIFMLGHMISDVIGRLNLRDKISLWFRRLRNRSL